MKKTVSILILVSIFCQCANRESTDLSTYIQGFWKVRQVPKGGGEPQILYAQYNDSLIQYWYEELKYLLPYGYTVDDRNHLIIWLPSDPNSPRVDVGVLKASGGSGFTLESDSQRLEYEKISFEAFEKATGEPWRKLEDK